MRGAGVSDELWMVSATELATLFERGDASPVEALESCLSRLKTVNPILNAVVTVDIESARETAQASTARWRAGNPLSRLDGVPLTVKDNIPVAGMRSTWGSRLYGAYIPERDETPVLRLREAGAVIVGKTNVPEMTLQGYTSNPLFGPTGNPWAPELTPGGSSGGAVAAVGSGIGPIALATDGGGSIRRPASHGGLVGLKPTIGRVPRRDGFPPILLDFEIIGPIARNVADLAATMAVISQPDPAAIAANGFGPVRQAADGVAKRILFVPTFAGAPVDPEIAASVAEAARNLSALGHRVEDGSGFALADGINAVWPIIAQTGVAWLMRDQPERLVDLGPDLRAMAEAGARLSAADHFEAMHAALLLRQDLAAFFRGYDLILTPTAAALPWPATEPYPPVIAGQAVGPRGSAVFTGFVNAAHLPAITLPCRPSQTGLPIGFQLVAAWGCDEDLVSIAQAYETAHPWAMAWQATAQPPSSPS
jgi:aspartyl-tRNA(Asn)/glutamyl-tRNA(Gln) amidotransferase subunit A